MSTLGLVISVLADKAMGKGHNLIIPYRDSMLTRVTQDALGGNCKTVMIFTISPAYGEYDETLSSLRYASRAKLAVNNPKTNYINLDLLRRNITNQVLQRDDSIRNLQIVINADNNNINEFRTELQAEVNRREALIL
jgi:hypothetical protein